MPPTINSVGRSLENGSSNDFSKLTINTKEQTDYRLQSVGKIVLVSSGIVNDKDQEVGTTERKLEGVTTPLVIQFPGVDGKIQQYS